MIVEQDVRTQTSTIELSKHKKLGPKQTGMCMISHETPVKIGNPTPAIQNDHASMLGKKDENKRNNSTYRREEATGYA
jgi:hypothetical protein